MRLGIGISLGGPRASGVPVNMLINSAFANGGGAAPTSWPQGFATGTSAPAVSSLGTDAVAYTQSATAQRPFLTQSVTLVSGVRYTLSLSVEANSGLNNDDVLVVNGQTSTYYLNGTPALNIAPLATGRLEAVFTSSVSGAVFIRVGPGSTASATGSCTFSRPKLEVGARATAWVA